MTYQANHQQLLSGNKQEFLVVKFNAIALRPKLSKQVSQS